MLQLVSVRLTPLVLIAPLASAGDPSDALPQSVEASFPAELSGLERRLRSPDESGGARIGGFLRTRFATSGDVDVNGSDLGGFSLDFARLELDGGVGAIAVHVSLEGSSSAPDTPVTYGSGGGHWGMFGDVEQVGSVSVLDAHATWHVSDTLHVRAGQLQVPFGANAALRDDEMLFLNHTVNGEHWRFRDTGLELGGQYERFGWRVALTNGFDGAGDELALFGRVTAALLDLGGPTHEGALGAGDGTHLRLGLGYYNDDGNNPDDIAMSFDADVVRGPLSAAFELVDYDKGATSVFTDNQQGQTTVAGDRTAWTLQGGWLFNPTWEAALRYEDLGDDDDTTLASIALNRYIQGHAAKLQLAYSSASSDVSTLEADILALGLTVRL